MAGDDPRWRATLGALLLFRVTALRRRVLCGLPPALERRLIASPRPGQGIVDGQTSTLEVAGRGLRQRSLSNRRMILCPRHVRFALDSDDIADIAGGQFGAKVRRNKKASFNHLVGARDDRRRNLKADRFRNFQVNSELERHRLRNGQIAGLGATQNLIGIERAHTK